jgi:hypothetical protein
VAADLRPGSLIGVSGNGLRRWALGRGDRAAASQAARTGGLVAVEGT